MRSHTLTLDALQFLIDTLDEQALLPLLEH